MTALILDDAAQHRRQHRMARSLDHRVIAGQRRELVDGAPGHMHGGKVAREMRRNACELLGELARGSAPAQFGEARVFDRESLRLEKALQHLRMKELLIHPARERSEEHTSE